jgi:hypothetical protein
MPSNFRDKDGKDPFSDEHGRNPYADEAQEAAAAVRDDPYAAPSGESYVHRPGDFETFLPHRGGRLFLMAVVSLLVGLVGIPVWYLFSAPFGILAFVGAVPVCVMAVGDLRAMRMRAMDRAGHRLSLWALLLGVLAALLASVNAALIVGRIIFLIRVGGF